MRYLLICIFCLFTASAAASNLVVPDELKYSSVMELPTGFMARGTPSVYGRSIETSADVKDFFSKLMAADRGKEIFMASALEWGERRAVMSKVLKQQGLRSVKGVSLDCPFDHCYLFAAGPFSWLITADLNHRVTDFELASARTRKVYPKGQSAKTPPYLLLDTIFGSGGIPSQGKGWTIDFAENGIFCSEFYADNNGVPIDHAVYKRRVKPDGSIESKEIDNWYECKAPW